MGRRILIVEDSREIADLVAMHLRDAGHEAVVERGGDAGLRSALSGRFDLIVLDLMLPGVNGLDICREVRSRPGYTPILMLTARSEEMDRVLGLEVGADDYLTKPFGIRELLARVRALFRRVDASRSPAPGEITGPVSVHGLTIDPERRRVTLQGRIVELTAKEFDLLELFTRHPGRVYTRAQLLDLVWGYGHEGYEHTVNTHINRLRSKIETDPSSPHYIRTVWGVGYRFVDPETEPAG
ncbi:MAG TPA: response regulator transcription factor [Candidatus Saccharimonadales bacterium]|nr:response regulator transcription factor [Candidatus Saccharimonadales bacterium]